MKPTARTFTGSSKTKVPTSADGYIRVSRVAGREGESFISPEVQRTKIEAWAQLHEVEIVQWWEELDASGARRDRPMFQLARERCARGDTGGIVVAKLDRFARSAVDALEGIKRLNEADARLVSVEDNFDGSTPMGRFAIGILTLIVELELERIKENWSSAVRSAIERGVHISATPPAGDEREWVGPRPVGSATCSNDRCRRAPDRRPAQSVARPHPSREAATAPRPAREGDTEPL